MKFATAVLLLAAGRPAFAQVAAEPVPAAPAFDLPALVAAQGPSLGVTLGAQGLVYQRLDLATGRLAPLTLSPEASANVVQFMVRASRAADPEAEQVKGLEAYLDANPTPGLAERVFTAGPGGRKRLTPLGRGLLMDLLTARDGTRFKPPKPVPGKGGALADLGSFDWAAWEKGRKDGRWDDRLEAYAYGAGRPTTRVLVSAARPVGEDRVTVAPSEQKAVLDRTGLDPSVLAAHQAKVVRALGNLVVLDVPTPQAAALGLDLERRGLESRPARVFQSAAKAAGAAAEPLLEGRGFAAPLFQGLPFPSGSASPFAPRPRAGGPAAALVPLRLNPLAPNPSPFRAENAESRDLMRVGDLWKAGMDGSGATVAIIDTGVDETHPDLKGRIVHYEDLTGEGGKDVEGHGTHVAGSIGGSGAASDGKYAGMAPKTKFVVFKVFDKDGNTSEDTILAAMDKASKLPKDLRPQVLNMSLGGPGDPESDPIAAMANRLTLTDNILVVASAGNDGPGRGTVGSPGNAEFALSVSGTDKKGNPAWYASRGPVAAQDGFVFAKPDLMAVAGDVNVPPETLVAEAEAQALVPALDAAAGMPGGLPMDFRDAPSALRPRLTAAAPAPKPGEVKPEPCVYAPGGVISDNSSASADDGCLVPGNPAYRYMSGTSMAAPMAAGVAADVAGWLSAHATPYRSTDLKAVMMETASDIGQKPEVGGAGLINGTRLAKTVLERAAAGVPIGNIAYMLSLRLTSDERTKVDASGQYERTTLGLLDLRSGHLINDDAQLKSLVMGLSKPPLVAAKHDDAPLPSGTAAFRRLAPAVPAHAPS